MKLEHLGIAVKSLEQSVPIFEKIFGVKASPDTGSYGTKS